MASWVTADSILDGIIAQLGAQLLASVGGAVSAQKPMRTIGRFLGAEFKKQEGLKRGIAGRTPAVRVRFDGSRGIRRTMGRRFERVESTIAVIIASDAHRSRDDRSTLLALTERVRSLVAARAFGLKASPLKFERMGTVVDDDELTALALTFTTRHWVDNTIDPGTDRITDMSGTITNADPADTKPLQVGLHETFP
jgi:hypothetical protein